MFAMTRPLAEARTQGAVESCACLARRGADGRKENYQMLTKRSKGIKECCEKIIADLAKMEKANADYLEFFNVMSADPTYSREYKNAKIEVARSATDNTMKVCADVVLDTVHKLYDLVEEDPETVNANDSKVQNVLSMINLLGADLPFEQAAYFVESARGDIRWLEMLEVLLKRYGHAYFADRCKEYRELPQEWELQDFAGKVAIVSNNPRDYRKGNFGWDIVKLKKWINILDCTVADAPDFKEQVARLKQELAMRNAENESLREKDALHIDIINHLTEKIGG